MLAAGMKTPAIALRLRRTDSVSGSYAKNYPEQTRSGTEGEGEIIHLQGHGNIRPRGVVVSVAPSLRICLLGDPELEPGGSRDFRSACFYG